VPVTSVTPGDPSDDRRARAASPGRRRRRGRHAAPRRSRPFRALAMALAVLVPAAGLTLLDPTTPPAEAAIVQWGTQGGTAPNYQATVNGDFLQVGNGVLACSGTALTQATTSGTCADLHAATTTATTNYNDFFRMVASNTVQGFTTNSSSATMTIPAGASVERAFLNWSANTGTFGGQAGASCSANATGNNAAAFGATRPDSASGWRTQGVQLKVGSGAIGTVPVGSVLADTVASGTAQYYSAGADVTTAFQGAATGSPITVSAGNIWAAQGAGCYAGWSLTVVYDYGTYLAGNAASLPHNVVYYEGHARLAQTDAPLTVTFDGFQALTTGTRFGYSLFEGDRGIVGDYAQYSRDGGATFAEIPNVAGQANNVGVSRADGSVRYTQTATTSAFTNASVDSATTNLPAVAAGDSEIQLRIGTNGDSYLLRSAVLSVPTAGLSVAKTLDGTTGVQYRTATEATAYTIVVTNTGSVALQDVVLTDPSAPACARTLTGTLQPGQSRTVTCTGPPPTAATSSSTVTARAQVSGNTVISVTSEASTQVVLSALSLTKQGALPAGATGRPGDVVTFTFTATNTGGGPLTGVAVTDPFPGLSGITYGAWPGGVAGTLPAGAAVTATATYALTQADVDRGSLANTATVTGRDADGGPQPTATAQATTPLPVSPGLTLTKTGALAQGATGRTGDVATFTFTLRNSGNQTLTRAAISDQLAGLSSVTYGTWPSGTTGTLAPGQQVTATATYALKQGDVDAAAVRNSATASATSPAGTAVSSTRVSATVPVAAAPALTTTKSAALPAGSTGAAGDVVTYTFRLTNAGNQTLTGVAVTDPLPGLSAVTYGTWPGGTSGTLAPGQVVTATATYTVRQADVDAGSVVNTATGAATSPAGTAVRSTAPATLPLSQGPAVALAKSGALAPGSTGRAGDTVTWSFTATNTGNVTLRGVAVTDQLAGVSAISYGTWASGTTGVLAPGQRVTATATYQLTQADVDAGTRSNTATVSGTPPQGAAVTASSTARVDVAAASAVQLGKTGQLAPGATGAVGDVVTWRFTVTNTGASTLSGVAVTEQLAGVSALSYAWPGAAGTLAPGAQATATATYALTQADVDAGSVVNTATASGRPANGATASSTAAATVAVASAPAVQVSKTGALAASATGRAGDVVTYAFVVRNTGNQTLTRVAVTDALAGLSAISYGTWPGTAGTLAPGQQVTATATYRLTQNDVDRGSVANTADVTGTPPNGAVVRGSSSTTVPVTAAPAVAVTKQVAPIAGGTASRAGDSTTYTFTLRNTGNQTLTGVAVADPLPGLSAVAYGTWPSGTAGTLAPGQQVTATATRTLTQADVDAGGVVNGATVTGTTPALTQVTGSGAASLPITPSGTLALTKTGAVAGQGAAGDVVTYTFTVRNTGTVTLGGVTVRDPLPGLSAVTWGTWPSGTDRTLAPGQQVTGTATVALTQADVDRGDLANSATVAARTPQGGAVAATAGTTVTVDPRPGLAVAKTAALAAGATGAAGSVVEYSFRLTNTGSVTLTGVGVTDPLPGLSAVSYGAWPSGAAGTLAPGQSVVATATRAVTQADVDAGSVANAATASGTTPAGAATTGGGAASVPLAAQPGLALEKAVAPGAGWSGRAGDRLEWSFRAVNTGTVTLTGVAVADPQQGLGQLAYAWPGTPGVLAPGEVVTATAAGTVTQADVDAGSVANSATVRGTTPSGGSTTATASAVQEIPSAPAVTLTKSAVVGGQGTVGSRVTYRFDVVNTGTVTVSDVAVADPLPGLSAVTVGSWPGAVAGQLAPGQSVRATATYVLTQADVDAGSLVNAATATATPPTGDPVTATGATTVRTATGVPSIGLVKSEQLAAGATGVAGDVVELGYRVTNTGALTLTGVDLADQQPGRGPLAFASWPSGTTGTLAPGQTVTATATYVLTQADVDAGGVSSTATASGLPPRGAAPVTATADGSVTTLRTTSLAFAKQGAVAAGGAGAVGDVVAWSFTLVNTGTTTLTAVGIADPTVSDVVVTWPGTPGTLAPGTRATAVGSTVVTQADVDAGAVVNAATASGTSTVETVSARTGATVATADQAPAIAVTKEQSLDAGDDGVARPGDLVSYAYTVTNTGTVTLRGVTLTDAQVGLSGVTFAGGGSTVDLAPGQTATATASYRISQADVDAGSVGSTVRAAGTAPSGAVVTADAEARDELVQDGTLAFEKRASFAPGDTGLLGDEIVYTFTVRNEGNVTVRLLEVVDEGLGDSPVVFGTWPGRVGFLAPGETVEATARHVVDQADVDADQVTNTAFARAVQPDGTEVRSPERTVTTVLSAESAVGIVKTAALEDGATGVAGDRVTYTYVLTNTGTQTLTDVTVSDPQPRLSPFSYAWQGTPGFLATGGTVTVTATYVLTQADVDAGSLSTVATTTGTTPQGATVTADDRATVVVVPRPDYTFEKSGVVQQPGGVGDAVDYTFTLANTGNVTLAFIQVSDPLPGIGALDYDWPGEPGVLAPGQDATATARYVITQADVDAGGVVNRAQAVASPPTGDPVVRQAEATSDTELRAPSLDVTATASLGGARGVAGDVVTLEHVVTNTGTTTLSGVRVAEQLAGTTPVAYGPWPGDEGVLRPGQTVTVPSTYVLTQADVDAGRVTAPVRASGTGASATGAPVVVTADASTGVDTVREDGLVVDKAATGGDGAPATSVAVGDALRYDFTVVNTGTTTLTGIALEDTLPGVSEPAFGAFPTVQGSLAPGERVTATATYTVTQGDVDAGSVANTGTVRATSPTSAVSATDVSTVPATAGVPQLSVSKVEALADGATGVAGDVVTFTYTTVNTGNVTLRGVTVVDGQPGVSQATPVAWPGTAGVLAPGQQVVATASYVLTQDDVDRGGIASTVTARGLPPQGARVAATADGGLVVEQRPALVVDKVGTVADGGAGRVGERIDYVFTVANSGTVTLDLLRVEDALRGLGDLRFGEWPGRVGQLAPAEVVTATASYTVTQADVDAGSVVNQALAIATPPSGDVVTAVDVSTVPLAGTTPAIRLEKTEALAPGAAGVAGDEVRLTWRITNTGTSTLTGVTVQDDQPALGDVAYGPWPGGTAGALAPGQSVTASAVHLLTQAEVDAGRVASDAVTTGTDPRGEVVRDVATGSVALTAPAGVTLDKASTTAGGAAVGDEVAWTFTVANTGAVTLTSVTVTDALPGVGAPAFTWPGAEGVLAPGAVATGTASYRVTQADIDAGSVANVATVQALPARGDVVQARDAAQQPTTTGAPALALGKAARLADGATGVAGDVVELTYRVTNTGNQTVTGVTLVDEQPGATAPVFGAFPGGQEGRLAPGQSVTASTRYVLTQADVDAGGVTSRAITTGTSPAGEGVAADVRAEAVAGVVVAGVADMSFTKRATLAAGSSGRVGQGIDYTFQVRNTGTVTLSLLDVEDQLPGLSDVTFTRWPGQVGVLAPGERVMGRASYTITQGDVDAGTVVNTATARAVAPDGTAVVRDSLPTTIATASQGPRIGLVKEADLAAGATGRAGDLVAYSYTLTNAGDVTLTGVTVADGQPGLSAIDVAWPGTPGVLAPGQVATATATHALTQAEVDAGSVQSEATASGTSPQGAVVTATDLRTVVVVPDASATFEKTVTPTDDVRPGDELTYAFRVVNTGTVTLDGVTVDDRLAGLTAVDLGPWPGGVAGELAPGTAVEGTATYVVTQADADSGSIANLATAVVQPPTGGPLTLTDATVVATAATQATIAVTKAAVLATGATGVAGDLVEFSYLVTNTGTSTLRGVTLSDAQVGAGPVAFGAWPSPDGRLAPGQSVAATASYRLTQADVDAGVQRSTVRTTATTVDGGTVSADAVDEVALTRTASAAFSKTAAWAAGGAGRVGDVARYSYEVANTGTVTLTGVAVTDDLAGLSPLVVAWPGEPGTLAPDQRATATAERATTQADVDAGSVVNAATVTATGPAGTGDPLVVADSATLATAATTPGIEIVKAAALADGARGVAGDVVDLSYTVTNTGDVTLRGVVVGDDQQGASTPQVVAWPGEPGVLAPGQVVTATGTYTVTQQDVDRGEVASRGTVVGTPPTGAAVRDESVAAVPLARDAAIALTERAALAPGDRGVVGEEVVLSWTVTNTGAVTLEGVTVAPRLPVGATLSLGPWPGAEGVLAPGQVVVATATYVVTQADVDRGRVDDVSSASGRAPGGVVVTDDATAGVPLAVAGPAIGIVKTLQLASGATGVAGDVVEYAFDVTNTGDVTLTGVGIVDGQPRLTTPTPGGVTLAPGATQRVTATYVLTQADVDAGVLASVATASGTASDGTVVTAEDDRPLVLTGAPALSVTKTATPVTAGGAGVGDEVRYRVEVRNTGTVTLTGVTASDPLPGLDGFAVEGGWPGAEGTLAPRQAVALTATYVLTQADVDAGSVVNTATGTGQPPAGGAVTGSDTATLVTTSDAPAIAVTKQQVLAPGAIGVAGDTVRYSYTVTNTGGSTLTGVVLVDDQPGLSPVLVDGLPAEGVLTLAPGASATATATYVLTQADVDAGTLASAVTATGTPPRGADVTATATGSTPLDARTGLALVKAGTLADGARGVAGDAVTWTFGLRNTGTVTLTDVVLDDPLPGLTAPVVGTWPTVDGVLLPGEEVTATATSTLTQADVDAGSVVNTATGAARTPDGGTVDATGTATVPTAAVVPGISVTKSQALPAGDPGAVGSVVSYSYRVVNTGTVTLRGVVLVDQQPGLSAVTFGAWPGEPGVLEPGQAVEATASYVLSQADLDAGVVASPVTVSGTAPGGTVVDDSAADQVVLPTSAALALDKTGVLTAGGDGAAGDEVAFTLVATNTGDTTLTGVAIVDDLPGLSPVVVTGWPGEPGVLAPGQQVTATATYALTQADVDAGGVDNVAEVTGAAPDGSPRGASGATRVVVTPVADLALTKTVAYAPGSSGRLGERLVYSFTVVNTGTATLVDVRVDDPMPGLDAVEYGPWPSTPGVLAPGESVTATAGYTITVADVQRGTVENTATAIATSGSSVAPDPTPGQPAPGGPGAPGASDRDGVTIGVHDRVLAFTGHDAGAQAVLALLLLLVGAGAALTGRRRGRTTTPGGRTPSHRRDPQRDHPSRRTTKENR